MKRITLLILLITGCSGAFGQDPEELQLRADQFRQSAEYDSAISYYDALGRYYRAQGVFEGAFSAFMESYALRDSLDLPGKPLSLLYLGSVQGYMEQHEDAAGYFIAALNLVKGLETENDSVRFVQANSNLGIELIELNQLDSAENVLNRANKIASSGIMRPSWFASLYTNYGFLEETRGNFPLSHRYYHKARKIWEPDSNYYRLSLVYNNLGVSSKLLGKIDSARYYFEQSRDIAEKYGYTNRLYETYTNMAGFYESTLPDRDSLSKYQDLKFKTYVSVVSEDRDNQIAYLQRRYNYEKVQKELAEQSAKMDQVTADRRLLLIIVLVLSLVAIVGYAVNKRRQVIKDREFARINEMLKDQEIASYNSILEVQESERKRIASELHDKLGSTLAAAKLYFNHLENDDDEVQENKDFTKGMSLLDDAVRDVRSISHSMATGVLAQFGLEAALIDLRETITGTGKLTMKLLIHGLDERLPRVTELHIYRMIQELVSNALKHSGATQVIVQLTQHSDELNVTVEDNGVGFDVDKRSDGIGLTNMFDRTKLLGGSVNIDSNKSIGTIISIDIPTIKEMELS